MIGGLMKSTSSLALTIAAGLVLSTNAFAADLGGNCCADLEERVAELEATTARKGNRKVSLTISGQVNRTLMYWNDGGRSNTYLGLDNSNSSTRFGFSGSAGINSEWKAGFSILLDVRDKGRSVLVTNVSEDGSSQERTGNANGDNLIRLRDANWWLESSRLGRLTVGRLTTAGPTGTVDLANIGVVASGGEGCIGTSLRWRDTAGALTALNIGSTSMGCAHPTVRAEGVKYTSPTFGGFTFNASVGEALKVETTDGGALGPYNANGAQGPIGMNYAADVRYAGEFNGLRLAATLGYEHSDRNDDDAATLNGVYNSWGAALSLLHVPTGLFLQGEYIAAENKAMLVNDEPYTALTADKGNRWHLQGGIRRNWFGIGDTSLYAEYGVHKGWLGMTSGLASGGVSADQMKIWGIGAVQSIDAAAMDLYIGYRNYSATNVNAIGVQDIDVLSAGARIKF